MAKLWDKGYDLDKTIEAFTVGDDPQLDQRLVRADCLGSIAHAAMLAKIGILADDEFRRLKAGLIEIIELDRRGEFVIRPEDEDVHTAVENRLVAALGDLGKKLHTARSRNDQVIVDLRLYMKEQLLAVEEDALAFCRTLADFAERHKTVPMPGRTHMQRAMPSSVGLWAGAFLESILDDLTLVQVAYELADQCPLGSAASYGVSFPIDRQYTSDVLGFAKVQNNVLYANNSRGKIESVVLSALVQIGLDLSKFAQDVILFSMPEFGYFVLPKEFCPGSSIMPQKRNPGPFELTRAHAATLTGLFVQVTEAMRGLPSGYNRDSQLTKGPLMRGFDVASACLRVMNLCLSRMGVDETKCLAGFSPEIFATDKAYELVKQGVPFRDAYRQVGTHLDELKGEDPKANILSKTHVGATGNLGLNRQRARIEIAADETAEARARLEGALTALAAEA